MCPYIDIFSKEIPSYGLMIALGLVVANILMYCKLEQELRMDFLILEGYILLAGVLGAKILYFLVSFNQIDWSRWNDSEYILSVLKGGFVFYGGLIGGMVGYYVSGKLHNIQNYKIMEEVVFGVPLAHGFGRIGCFMAGCCYGFSYSGFGAVTYPEESFGPSGVSCFPVQVLEAVLLWLLSIVVYLAIRKNSIYNPIGIYMIGYSVMRFFLEYLRADVIRGSFGEISTSQLISILVLCVAGKVIGIKKKVSKSFEQKTD